MIGTSCWAKSSACLWSIFRIQPCKPDPRNTIGSPKNLWEPWSPDARKQPKIQKPTKKIPRKIRVYLISSTSSRRFNHRKPKVAMNCSPTQVACRFHRLNCGLEGFVIAWIFFNFHITWFQTYMYAAYFGTCLHWQYATSVEHNPKSLWITALVVANLIACFMFVFWCILILHVVS